MDRSDSDPQREPPSVKQLDDDERSLRAAELNVRKREIAERRLSLMKDRGVWSSPIVLTLLAGALGLFANALGAYLTARGNRELEHDQAEANLILKAIEDRDSLQRISNLSFFLAAGLLRDPSGTIKKLVDAHPNRPDVPSSVPSNNLWTSASEPMSVSDAAIVQRLQSFWVQKQLPTVQTVTWPNGTKCGPFGLGGDSLANYLKNRIDQPDAPQTTTVKQLLSAATPQANPTILNKFSEDELAVIAPTLGKAVTATGFIIKIRAQPPGGESVNCRLVEEQFADTHIAFAESPDDSEAKAVVVEVTPRVRISHPKWTTEALNLLVNARDSVRFTGWAFFDPLQKGHLGRFRGTLWEIHPVTRIEFFHAGRWQNLDATVPQL